MPLVYQQDINLHTRLGVWHITEDESFFEGKHLLKYPIAHQQKRLQTIAGRYLMQILYPAIPLHLVEIAPTRKPFIPGDPFHFSISHCGDFAAAIVSTFNRVGVDIEIPQPKIISLQHKFLSDDEVAILQTSGLSETANFTIGWSIKEAVFKWYAEGGLNFIDHMVIEHFEMDEHSGFIATCRFKKNQQQLLYIKGMFHEQLCCVYLIT